MKILIIDDEPLVRRALKRVAVSKQYTVIETEDGQSGLELWHRDKPDIVFLDILMPRLTGPQVLERVDKGKTKVILMSAYSGEYNLNRALQMGADLFIAKPFDDIFRVISAAEELLNG